ncbi:helix-turn-helix domain-containing protein [Limosilactobacillus caccae]|uniref:helix-turn-helix domain-containing protein n=1 Tax=Limosilactobacillus caccae TaxID=1926284 RepID=UPI00097038EE|nr:helix-turn-helix domain-containing protein [Limosilactobacillus caccae]
MTESMLRFFSYQQPRRIRVVENVLKSRRTVANLFWAQQYGILPWLGANRRLSRADYDHAIASLVEQELLRVDEEKQALLTEKGVAVLENKRPQLYEPSFYAWFWLANTSRLMERLLLAVQVVSEYSYHQRKYVPLQLPYSEMQAVKQWFRQNYSPTVVKHFYDDLHRFSAAIASEDEKLAVDFVNMLVGHGTAGWTLEQAGQYLQMPLTEVGFLRHDEMLALAAYAAKLTGPLQQLLGPLLNTSPLTHSAQLSLGSYQRGFTIGQIAKQRRLKENTVREHLLEAAIMTPDQLKWEQLLPAQLRDQLSQQYKGAATGWHYQGPANDNQGFFEFRLYQIYQGGKHD